jgi:hypothetical protein
MNKNSPKRIYLSPPCMLGGERELLIDAFDSNWIAPLGPTLINSKLNLLSALAQNTLSLFPAAPLHFTSPYY